MMIIYDARDMIKHHHIQSPFLYMKALIESIKLEIKHENKAQAPFQILLYMEMNMGQTWHHY